MGDWVGGDDWYEAALERYLLGEVFALVARGDAVTQDAVDRALGVARQPEHPSE